MSYITQKLSAFVSYFTGRYAPAFITLLVVAAIFFFYFTVIVSKNETNLKERSFRGLHRMADNIAKKIDNYTGENSLNFLSSFTKAGTDTAYQSFLQTEYGLSKTAPDTLAKNYPPFFIRFDDGWKLFFKDTATTGTPASMATASIEKFIAPLLRRDLFQYYFLASGDSILYDELNISNPRVSSYLTGNTATDSVKKGPVIQTGQTWRVEIEGKEFKLFLLPFIVSGKYTFKLGGYMPVDTYAREKKYIPTYAIVWLVIGIMLVLLMFPLLKVFLMHRSEQLSVQNAVSSLASIHVLGSILVLVVLNTYVYFNIVREGADEHLKILAGKIDTTFKNEVDSAMRVMDSAEHQLTRKLDQHLSPDSIPYSSKSYPYFLHISWADSAGRQLVRWANSPYPAQKIDVSDRDYFQAVKKGTLWRRENGTSFYVTEISSRVENKNLALISRPASVKDSTGLGKKLAMVSLSSPFRSLFGPVLPDGYGFCVIKENGDVLFHLDETRNLNENLVEECTDNDALISLLHAKKEGYFGSRYSGSTQRFYLKPIAGMPYYIVSFRDMRSIWSEDLDVISACSIFTLMNLAVILLAIIIIQAAGYKHSLLQRQSILFSWLQPNNSLTTAYRSVSFVYLMAMLLQVIFFLLYKHQDQLCQVGISFSYAYILISYAYYRFAVAGRNEDDERKQEVKKPFWILAGVYIVATFIFFLNLVMNGHGWYIFLASQILIPIAFIRPRNPFGKIGNNVSNYCRNQLVAVRRGLGTIEYKKSYRWWYVLSVFSFIAATAIVPAAIFYFLSFKEERLLSLKRSQIEFAAGLLEKSRRDTSTTPDNFRLSFHEPFYFECFADSMTRTNRNEPMGDSSDNGFEVLYKRVKPSFSSYSREIEFLKNKYNASNDFNWQYMQDQCQLLLRYKVARTNTYLDGRSMLSIYSPIETGMHKTKEAIKRNIMSFILLITGLVILLLGFMYLLNRLIKKVFFDGYDDAGYYEHFETHFVKLLPPDENIFVIGLVNSGKSKAIKGYLQDQNAIVTEIEIARLADEEIKDIIPKPTNPGGSKNVILIRHFEMFMNDIAVSEKKLLLLEALLRLEKDQIIILSSRPFESMIIKTPPEEKEKSKDFADRWLNVMNKFYIAYHQWAADNSADTDTLRIQTEKDMQAFSIQKVLDFWYRVNTGDTLRQVPGYLHMQIELFFNRLDDECSHSDFLRGLRDPVLTYITNEKEAFFTFDFQYRRESHMMKIIKRHFNDMYENTCLKIQSLSNNYYIAAWQSLTRDEQRTLYDIALDQMVNPSNRDTATRLAGLGLVKRLDNIAGYEIMSKSFRNFIFTQLDKKDVNSFKEEAASKGSWSSFQLPVLIVVIALSIFLFTTQKDAFTNIVAYLGAALGAIGALLKLLGVMPSKGS